MGKASRRLRQSSTQRLPAATSVAGHQPVTVILTALVAATPLLLLNHVFIAHDVMPKLVAILTGAALLLFFVRRWCTPIRLNSGPFRILLTAQFISVTLSTVVSSLPGLSFAGATWRRFGWIEQSAILVIALATGLWTSRDPRWLRTLSRAASVSGALLALYACLQYFGFDPFLDQALYKLDYLGAVVRPPATMGQAIYFAAWMAPVCILSAAAAAHEGSIADPSVFWKRFHATAAILGLIAVLLSGSRGALLAALTGFAVLAFHLGNTKGFAKRFAITATLLIAAMGTFAFTPPGAQLRGRFAQWVTDPGGTRLQMWRETLGLIAKHPVLGTGPDTFGEEFRVVQSESLSRAYPDFFNETPHNAFLDAASAQGLPGLFILCGVFAIAIFRRERRDALNSGIAAAAVAILTASLFASFSLMESLLLWSLAAIITADPVDDAAAEPALPAIARPLAAVFAAVFIATALMLAMPDAVYTGLADAVARNDATDAEALLDSASHWSFGLPLAGNELYASRQLATLARSASSPARASQLWHLAAKASADAERAGEERASAAFQAALLAASVNDGPGAETATKRAIALAPNWYRPHLFLSQILQAFGRIQEATAEQQRAIALAGDRH